MVHQTDKIGFSPLIDYILVNVCERPDGSGRWMCFSAGKDAHSGIQSRFAFSVLENVLEAFSFVQVV